MSLCAQPGSPQPHIIPPHILTLVLTGTSPVLKAGARTGPSLSAQDTVLSRDLAGSGASVSANWGFHKQAQSADFWIKHSGLQAQSCHFQALTLGFYVPIWKSR